MNERKVGWLPNNLSRWPTSSNLSSMKMSSMSVANKSDLPSANVSLRRFAWASRWWPPWPPNRSKLLPILHRQFNELWELESDYKAFYKPLLKSTSPEFFRTSLCHIMSQLTMKVLGVEAGQAFSAFNRLLLQDGSSFALHEALAEVFPGRFNAVSPAAVELHCTLDVLQDAPITIALSPDTDSEHDYRPEPKSLRGDVCLADRGYLDLAYLRDIDRHGG